MTAGLFLGYYATGIEEHERELEVSESRFRALTENAPFAVITIDESSTIRYANDTVTDLFGYAPEEIVGKPTTHLLPDRFVEDHRERIERFTSGEADVSDHKAIELTGRDADGTEFPLEVSSGSYTEDGTQLFTGILRDISDRKEAEHQLQEHTSKVTKLHEIATDITLAASKDEVHERAATGAAELFRGDVARVAVAQGDQLVPAASSSPETVEECDPIPIPLGYAGQSYKTGEVIRIDDLTDTRSSAASPIQDGGAPPNPNPRSLLSIPLAEYGVLQVVAYESGVFSDRDEEVAAMLATHVTTALEQTEAEAMIRRERDRLEEFASILSHDIRNPLNAAKGRLDFVEEESEHVEAIDRSLDRIERLIEDMLTLAREGEDVGDTEQVDLRTVADQCWATVESESASLHIDSLPHVEADRGRLSQVFENLYRNAIEHGGENVTIKVGQMADGFYIEDTGPGIPEDERDEIFESGYSTNQDGTGFGLSIVEQIIEAHGWEIGVTEGSDGGARFEITVDSSVA